MAWIGDETVQNAFSRWRADQSAWAGKLFISPDRYTEVAGWEMTDEGKRRDLFHPAAFPLVPPATLQADNAVKVGVPAKETCRWCGLRLVGLLQFRDIGAIFPDQGAGTVRVVTCHTCTCFGTIFMKHDRDGNATWHTRNERPGYLPKSSDLPAFPDSPLVMATTTRHFLEAADWAMLPGVAFSQVGGLSTWIQDAQFPACPDCQQTMPFVGQISNADFEEYGEGIYYAFRCSRCNVTATCYQQT
jgi:hypothetical protein